MTGMSAVLGIVIRTSTLLVCVSLLSFALRRASASVRHALWAVGLLAVLVFPVVCRWIPEVDLAILPEQSMKASAIDTTSAPVSVPAEVMALAATDARPSSQAPALAAVAVHVQTSEGWSVGQWLALMWVLGSLAFFLSWMKSLRDLHRLTQRSRRLTADDWDERLRTVQREIGVPRTVELRISTTAISPMTWGVFRPVILLPMTALDWSPIRQRLVLAHEMAHVQRNDSVGQILAQTVCCIYWFNPIVWYAGHRLHAERERACDDSVLRLGADGADYADHLLQITRNLNSGFSQAAVSMAHASQLKARLIAILDSGMKRSRTSRIVAITLLTIIGVLTLSIAAIQVTALSTLVVPAFAAPLGAPLWSPKPAQTPAASQQSSAVVESSSSPNGMIEGTIVDVLTGRPIGGVQIKVLTSSTISTIDGQFHLSDIPAGTQNVITSVDGYLPAPWDDRYLTLTPGQQMKGVVLRLSPTGIVTGRVLNSNGEPIAGAQIVGYREEYNSNGELQLQIAAGGLPSDRTNDRGQFRLFKFVDPGEYVFRVEPPQLPPGASGETFAPFFFPGTSDPAKAGKYSVKAGEETDLKNITLPPFQGGTLHLRVIDQTGAIHPGTSLPVNQVMLQVIRGDVSGLGVRFGPFPSGGPGKDVGRLPQGKYEIYATLQVPGQGLENQSTAVGHASIEITDQNTDLDLIVRKGPRMTGHVLEEGSDGTIVPISGVRLTFSNSVIYRSFSPLSGPAGTFEIASTPAGSYELGNVANAPSGMSVKSISAGTHDILAEGLLVSDEDIDVRVILARPAGTVSGKVTDASGGGVRGATVLLVGPDDKRSFQSGSFCHFIGAMTDQNGAYEVTVSLSGTYRVLAGKPLNNCAPRNAEFMKQNEARIASARVDGGARVVVDLKPLDP